MRTVIKMPSGRPKGVGNRNRNRSTVDTIVKTNSSVNQVRGFSSFDDNLQKYIDLASWVMW